MKAILATFIFILGLVPLVAQANDTIPQGMLEQPPSKIELLTQGRNSLLDNLENGELNTVREIKDDLIQVAGNNINSVFSPREYMLVLYWTEEYANLLSYIRNYPGSIDEYTADPSLKALAATDQLYQRVSFESVESFDMLVSFIYEAQLSEREKDFLELHLFWLIFGPTSENKIASLAEIHDLADAYLKKYPNSGYEMYIHHNIRFKLGIDDWAFGFEAAMGYAGMQGDIATQFNDAFLIRMSVEASFKKTILAFNINAGGTSTQVDFPYRDTEWLQGSQALLAGIDITAGYRLIEIKKLSFTPFLGVGVVNFSPVPEEDDEDYVLKNLNYTAQNYLAGVNCTFKIKSTNNIYHDGGSSINLRYTFTMPQYNGRKGIMSGNMHWITLGWGMNGRPINQIL